MKRLLIAVCMIMMSGHAVCAQPPALAQDKDFSALVLAAKTDAEASAILEEAQGTFFQQNRYQEFVDFLANAAKKKKTIVSLASYYTGVARYQQMKHLEEIQNWDEYFSKGNDYRKEITDNLEKSVKVFPVTDPLHVSSRLILWQFHKDQQDVFQGQALDDLMAATVSYAAAAKDLKPLKAVADKLLAYDERAKAKELYKLYGEKIISSDLSDDALQNTAMSFYKQGTMELAQALYTVYIDRIAKSASPDKAKLELIDIAKLFSYKKNGAYDLYYAEKVFARIESMFGPGVFNEALAYQRALNTEKNKDFSRAKDLYAAFVAAYPQSGHYDEALLKTGLIALYVTKDIKAAQEIFGRLSGQPSVSSQVISSLYQLGLIAQWQGENATAKEYYTKLVESAKDSFGETVSLAKARLLEVEEARPLEFNIKSMLDVTLKPENSQFSMNRVDIKASSFMVSPGEELTVTSTATPPESGCMQVQLQYFWSGDISKGAALSQESSFAVSYADPGTKVIGLVVTTPAGVVDRGIEFVDVI
jgi:TolA-binding protein